MVTPEGTVEAAPSRRAPLLFASMSPVPRYKLFVFSLLLFLLAFQDIGAAAGYPAEKIIGAVTRYRIKADDSLIEVARKYDLGYGEIVAANPGVDPLIPEPGSLVTIPTSWILPDVSHYRGIVINLAEMRLYFFPQSLRGMVITYPIGIGDEGWETPTGTFTVIEKIANPDWHVPVSIRKQKPELPAVVPAGPDNPLGTHALRLSIGTVLIHGTNRPYGIGRRVSHGCIHLYPKDIPRLFSTVRIGTPVTVIDEPVKCAHVAGRVFVEIHGLPGEDRGAETLRVLTRKGLLEGVDQGKLAVAIREMTGIPTDVSRDAGDQREPLVEHRQTFPQIEPSTRSLRP